jgi:hypothetical protein
VETTQPVWLTIIIASISGGLMGGLLNPFVSSHIQKQKDIHNRKQRILDEISGIISEIVIADFGTTLTTPRHRAEIYKYSNQLLGLGLIELSTKISLFLDYWDELRTPRPYTVRKDLTHIRKYARKIAEEISSYKIK